MDIGMKLKTAREEKNLTQEQVAEKLNVSRQTISNWENNRTYPDIVSVVRLSDIYCVTLDELIKGDKKMIEHLDDSTNVVKKRTKQIKLIELSTYFVVWLVGILFFHLFLIKGDEMAYSIIFLYIALPLASAITCAFIGADRQWNGVKWLMPLVFGMAGCLGGYLTFDVANMISTSRFFLPDMADMALFFLLCAVPSYIALALSYAVIGIKAKRKIK